VHSTGVETSGLWCASDRISCMLGSVHVMSLFRACLLFRSQHLMCADPKSCLWDGKGLSSKSLSKEVHKKSSSCKKVAFLFETLSSLQWGRGAKPSPARPVLFCLAAISSLSFHDLIFFPGYSLSVGLYGWLPISVQQST